MNLVSFFKLCNLVKKLVIFVDLFTSIEASSRFNFQSPDHKLKMHLRCFQVSSRSQPPPKLSFPAMYQINTISYCTVPV